VTKEQVANWIAAYERTWRTPGIDTLGRIFAAGATYQQAPYATPVVGLAAIGRMWEQERDGPDEVFTMASEVVAVDGPVAVVRAEVRYGNPVRQEWRDLWILRFDTDGRCVHFEEWPFSPSAGQIPESP
jgi:SnoaL-like domain